MIQGAMGEEVETGVISCAGRGGFKVFFVLSSFSFHCWISIHSLAIGILLGPILRSNCLQCLIQQCT
jgi:hypothetical protein